MSYNYPGIIIIAGGRRTGKTSLITRIINGFRLRNPRFYNHRSMDTFDNIERKQTVRRTLVLDGDYYHDNFFRENERFFDAVRHQRATVILTTHRLEDIPYSTRMNSDYTFIFPNRGFAYGSYLVHNNRILYSQDFDRYLDNIRANNFNPLPHIDEEKELTEQIHNNPIYRRLNPDAIPFYPRIRNQISTSEKILENLNILQNIIFENKENISDGDYLEAMNSLFYLHGVRRY